MGTEDGFLEAQSEFFKIGIEEEESSDQKVVLVRDQTFLFKECQFSGDFCIISCQGVLVLTSRRLRVVPERISSCSPTHLRCRK